MFLNEFKEPCMSYHMQGFYFLYLLTNTYKSQTRGIYTELDALLPSSLRTNK